MGEVKKDEEKKKNESGKQTKQFCFRCRWIILYWYGRKEKERQSETKKKQENTTCFFVRSYAYESLITTVFSFDNLVRYTCFTFCSDNVSMLLKIFCKHYDPSRVFFFSRICIKNGNGHYCYYNRIFLSPLSICF